jgi:hypothetical protein
VLIPPQIPYLRQLYSQYSFSLNWSYARCGCDAKQVQRELSAGVGGLREAQDFQQAVPGLPGGPINAYTTSVPEFV